MIRTLAALLLALLAVLVIALWPAPAHALPQALAYRLAVGDGDERVKALNDAVQAGDPTLAPFLQALLDDAVKVAAGKAYVIQGERATDAATGQATPLPPGAEDVMNNNRLRRELQEALSLLALLAPDAATRQAAMAKFGQSMDADQAALLDKALALTPDARIKAELSQLKARALTQAAHGKRTQAWGERLGLLFTGASLGSILLLVALGLAISYGLMGVINMAHGELMMIGAYATWLTQNAVRAYAPAAFDFYLWLAVPASFLAAAAVGAVLERGVIRFLYGRPLETLLATWGISLMLMQTVRSLFGAQNVAVENPAWMSGGWQPLPNLTLPFNRIAIIVFALLVLGGVALLIARTRLGLFVRGVTQNRRMASCVGVNTARVDTLAFALGAGIAGLAGCALSQVGNVGPDLGQSYIVDAFMVVVLGGVGQLAGTVWAALGLGVLNKLLEGVAGAVLAKIIVLVLIVVVIQKRPQGLFAAKGRSVET